MDVASLADLLRETAEHHDPYEKTHAAHNWWDWYAAYINASMGARRTRQPRPPVGTWSRSSTSGRCELIAGCSLP